MSRQHTGNILNSITFEEHDGDLNAKKVSLVSGATIYAVVNTAAAGTLTVSPVGLTTLAPSPNYIGLVTVAGGNVGLSGNVTLDPGSKTQIVGNVTLSDSKSFIGLVSVGGGSLGLTGNVTISDSKGYIGLTTSTLGAGDRFIGLATVVQASSARSIVGNVTLSDAKTYIGLVSVSGTVGIIGNVTLSDSKGFIGLVTLGGGTAWTDPKTYIGLATVSNATAWPDPKTYIGLVTVDIGTNNSVAIKGNVTLTDSKTFIGLVTIGGISTVTLADPKGFIGLVTIGGMSTVTLADPKGFIGLVSVGGGSLGIIGNLTLSDSKNFIGLVTAVPSYGSNVTIYTQVISASGNTTVFVAPNGNRFFLKTIHVASLGRSEVEIRSGATTLIPFTALATTGGYVHDWGEYGLPGRAQADAFVVNLNGSATIAVMASTYFQP